MNVFEPRGNITETVAAHFVKSSRCFTPDRSLDPSSGADSAAEKISPSRYRRRIQSAENSPENIRIVECNSQNEALQLCSMTGIKKFIFIEQTA